MLLRNGKKKYNNTSNNFMLLRNGKKKFNNMHPIHQIHQCANDPFHGIPIFDEDYYQCANDPFDGDELNRLKSIYCTAKPVQRYRDTRRGGYFIEVKNQTSPPLYQSIHEPKFIVLVENAIHSKNNQKLLILLRILERYLTYGVLTMDESQPKKYPWIDYGNQLNQPQMQAFQRPKTWHTIDLSMDDNNNNNNNNNSNNDAMDLDDNNNNTISIKQENY